MPNAVSFDLFGRVATYRELGAAIDRCADALASLGLRRGDHLTIAMPTSPQSVIAFYATNKLGAVASLIHPLSTPPEITHCLNTSHSRIALTLDAFYDKPASARAGTIQLLSANLISEGLQVAAWGHMREGDSIPAPLPRRRAGRLRQRRVHGRVRGHHAPQLRRRPGRQAHSREAAEPAPFDSLPAPPSIARTEPTPATLPVVPQLPRHRQ
jgi:acyl-CoA synthetase (AMP-forming)/AMP-acid ligase II